jgi:hypothetical protein
MDHAYGLRKHCLDARNVQMGGWLGSRPAPQGLGSTDYLAHLVATVPQKGVTLRATPQTKMVPAQKHTLTVGWCCVQGCGFNQQGLPAPACIQAVHNAPHAYMVAACSACL